MGYCRTPSRAIWPVGLALAFGCWPHGVWADPLVPHPAVDRASADRPVVEVPPLGVGAQDVALRSLVLPSIDCPVVDRESPDPRLAFLASAHAERRGPTPAAAQPIHIPEPASIVLLATGAVGLLARRALRRGQGTNRG